MKLVSFYGVQLSFKQDQDHVIQTGVANVIDHLLVERMLENHSFFSFFLSLDFFFFAWWWWLFLAFPRLKKAYHTEKVSLKSLQNVWFTVFYNDVFSILCRFFFVFF